ncbi:30S ribosomal protein S6 [Desertibaculum subflavum]|uniref:30S ribosomal protein S6 n=1 Tax=Desertibaculum subflavum TaxID=2268458 RepID=UPI000E662C05
MAFYENVFIVRQDVSATQVETLANEFGEIVKQNGGEVKKVEPWGLRSLAYRIRKNRKGHYMLLGIDAPAAALAELERNQRLHDDVIRYLTVKVDAIEEGPSAVLVSRAKDDRPGGGRREGGFRGGREGGGFRGDRDGGGGGYRGDRDGFRGDRRPAAAETTEG